MNTGGYSEYELMQQCNNMEQNLKAIKQSNLLEQSNVKESIIEQEAKDKRISFIKPRKNKGFTLVELIVVIIIMTIAIGVTIGGIYLYVGKAYKNRDIKVLNDTARICKEISITKPIKHDSTLYGNCTFYNIAYENNFYNFSYGWSHDSDASIVEHKTDWETWFVNELKANVENEVNELWSTTSNSLLPKDKGKQFMYFWHTDENGIIDYVIVIYADGGINSIDSNFVALLQASSLDETETALTTIKSWDSIDYVAIL